MKYPGEGAYRFPEGPSHESPCMSQYFRSEDYQAKKEQWFREAGITTGSTTPKDHDQDEKPEETEETEEEDHD